MFGKKFKKRIKKVTLVLVVLFSLLVIRLGVILKDTKIVSAISSNYVQKENISDKTYNLLDINGEDLIDYNIKFILTIDSEAFLLNNSSQDANNLLTLYWIMKNEDSDFSFYNINKESGKIKYEIKEETYNQIENIIGDLKGIYIYKYYETKTKPTWSIENILKSPTSFKDNSDKGENSLEVYISESTQNNMKDKTVFQKNTDGTYSEGCIEENLENINVQLTLDKELQDTARNILNKEEFSEFPNMGAVIIESETGKILSLAQKDETQPNLVTGAGGLIGYEPGSIFKILTLEASMKYLGIDLNQKEECTGRVCGKVHGELTILDAFKVSCNEVFAKLGDSIGSEKLLEFAKSQGLFQNILGLDIESGMESIGDYEEDNNISNISIGQSMRTNLIQITSVISTIVNNGIYVRPYIINNFQDNEGNIIKAFQGESHEVISSKVAENIKCAMDETVLRGTANIASIDGVEVGAKTGTAEVNSSIKNLNGWFVGYCNINNKYYSIGVFVPNIKSQEKENTGGNTAGPVFRELVLALKDYYNKN